MPAMRSKSGGKKSASSSVSSSFTTPDRALRGKERQERLLQQGLLASPFSPVPIRPQLQTSSANAHRRNQQTTKNSSHHTGPSSISNNNNNTSHYGHNNNNKKEEDCRNKTNNHNNQIENRNNNNVVIFHLIRHGQSIAQTVNRERRLRDTNLWDCGLSPLGIQQALAIVLPPTVRLIVSSPLTRAVTTACLAAQAAAAAAQQQRQKQQQPDNDDDGVAIVPIHNTIPILIHYHLRELGSMIPENIPRRIQDVQDDLAGQYGMIGITQQLSMIDWDTLRPVDWPHRHDESPKLLRRDRVRDALYWLSMQYGDVHAEIAVVCHYHVIMSVLNNGCGGGGKMVMRADNATIISCEMCRETGAFRLVSSSSSTGHPPTRPPSQQKGRRATNTTADDNNDDDPMETD
jgi:hypothetical protein